ncbi:MAG: tRNA pseudouridine(38-40) synthase TruA [Bacteroidota bacterium]|jgi:tRNA pseudouridine38-40 synthase
MPRYFLQLSYHGASYNGWQIQENTNKTVQQVLQEKLGKLLPEKVAFVTGCGRTDTGVHAQDFYAHFDTIAEGLHKDPKDFQFKLNRALPNDIGIKNVFLVSDKANARFDAKARTYEYLITRQKTPMLNDRAWMVYGELNFEQMLFATEKILKTTNFKSFAKSNDQPHDNDCIMMECSLTKDENDTLWKFKIKANRFLRNMVRAIVGTLVEVGKEKLNLEEFEKIITIGDRSMAGMSAPAQGLSLVKVDYPENIFTK